MLYIVSLKVAVSMNLSVMLSDDLLYLLKIYWVVESWERSSRWFWQEAREIILVKFTEFFITEIYCPVKEDLPDFHSGREKTSFILQLPLSLNLTWICISNVYPWAKHSMLLPSFRFVYKYYSSVYSLMQLLSLCIWDLWIL